MGPAGLNAAEVIGELRANHSSHTETGGYFVDDWDARPCVVTRDEATGHLVVDYYSFHEVTQGTFQEIQDRLDPKTYSVEERLHAGRREEVSSESRGQHGTSGRGSALIVADSLNTRLERMGVGAHMRIEINPQQITSAELRSTLQQREGIVLTQAELDRMNAEDQAMTERDLLDQFPDL